MTGTTGWITNLIMYVDTTITDILSELLDDLANII